MAPKRSKMRIFVGNLPRSFEEDKIKEVFSPHGEVTKVTIPRDRYTNAPRGFAFVDMPDDEEAKTAMEALNGTELEGRELRVEEARPPRESRGGYNRGGDRDTF